MSFKKNQSISTNAFTLIEMLIVLIIMWILLMFTAFLSWEQIQKIKNKSVKESILSERQLRYSRNLWSSSFAWKMYDNLEVLLNSWSNEINYAYMKDDEVVINNNFTDRFELKCLILDYEDGDTNINCENNISLYYSPYNISCNISDNNKNLVIVTRINDSKDYCFEINRNNCRLTEIANESSCGNIKKFAHIE